MGADMSTEELLHAAIDGLRETYRDEPWASWATAWSSGEDRSATAAEEIARAIENNLGMATPADQWDDIVRRFPGTKLEDFRDADLFEEAAEVANSQFPRAADAGAQARLIVTLTAYNLTRSAAMLANPDRGTSTEERSSRRR